MIATDHKQIARAAAVRAFMQTYSIRLSDIAEQLTEVEGKPVSASRVHGMLFRNSYMPKRCRDRLLDLGFPADALPPEKPVARFPGLCQTAPGGQAAHPQSAA